MSSHKTETITHFIREEKREDFKKYLDSPIQVKIFKKQRGDTQKKTKTKRRERGWGGKRRKWKGAKEGERKRGGGGKERERKGDKNPAGVKIQT